MFYITVMILKWHINIGVWALGTIWKKAFSSDTLGFQDRDIGLQNSCEGVYEERPNVVFEVIQQPHLRNK
jgi:hypothetical protein